MMTAKGGTLPAEHAVIRDSDVEARVQLRALEQLQKCMLELSVCTGAGEEYISSSEGEAQSSVRLLAPHAALLVYEIYVY
jgi:hypothetical protein